MGCPEEIRAFADARLREMWDETYKLRFYDLYNRKDAAVLSMRQITAVYPGLKELSLVSSFFIRQMFIMLSNARMRNSSREYYDRYKCLEMRLIVRYLAGTRVGLDIRWERL
jgi:hypothetical protein